MTTILDRLRSSWRWLAIAAATIAAGVLYALGRSGGRRDAVTEQTAANRGALADAVVHGAEVDEREAARARATETARSAIAADTEAKLAHPPSDAETAIREAREAEARAEAAERSGT